MKFGIAEYGLNVWYGGDFDPPARWDDLKALGYDGVERIGAATEADALLAAAALRRARMDFATCRGPNVKLSIRWAAALGKAYVWTDVSGKEFDVFCRNVNYQVAASARWGVQTALHNHLGTLVESQAQLEQFLAQCPDCGLILDTAHLAAADGDPVEIVRKYPGRLTAIHLKDWLLINPDIGLDEWWVRGRFCELNAGNVGLDNVAVMKALVDVGYDGWVFVEHDTHLQDPLKDLAISRQVLRDAGF